MRKHKGLIGVIEKSLLIAIPIIGILSIVDIFLFFGISFWIHQYLALILALVLAVTPLIVPARKKDQERLLWYDLVFSIAGFVVGLYLALFYPKLVLMIGTVTWEKVVFSVTAIFLILENCRRLFGWPLVIITGVFFLYAHFGYLAPGILSIKGISWERLFTHLYMDPESLLGIPLRITGTVVLAFILFGQMFFATGGGKFLSDAAMALMGKYRGGVAKVAVGASSAFGTLSGSAVANVMTTGIVTIPLIKQSGYTPQFAAAVEAVASTGGQIMPPVMGAAAFLMATFLGIPYGKVALAATIPALLYYLGVFLQVDLEAAKKGIKGLSPQELPSLKKVIAEGWLFLIPVVVIVYALFILFAEPQMAGLYASGSVLGIAMLKKSTRINIKKLLNILEQTGQGVLDIVVIAAVAGLIIGVVFLTGLGYAFTQWLLKTSGESIFSLLLITAGACIVLGMGMTVTAAYVVVVILLAPALIQAGMSPLVAHMFVFYYAVLSFLTPPVCVAVYAAASIAGSKPLQTAFQAMGLGIVAYLVPFAFAFNPALLLIGSPFQVISSTLLVILGIGALGVGIEGYLFGSLSWLKRILFISGSIGLFSPWGILRIIGMIVVAVLLFIEWKLRKTTIKGVKNERVL